jgi:Zn-finger nucleic acid-binding protein
MPQTMYRDQIRRCPQCGHDHVPYDAREKWRCKSCQGVLVAPSELAIELGEVGDALAETDDPPGPPADARLGCPVCAEPMRRFLIDDIEIDRCGGHGVWFDGGEIGRIRGTIASHGATPALVRLYDALFAQLTAQPPPALAPAAVPSQVSPLVVDVREWRERRLCPDGACIGVIGPNDRCKVCGQQAKRSR